MLELRNDPYKGKSDKSDPVRLRELFIDPGPRAIKASAGTSTVIAFDATTPATYADASGAIVPVPSYPKSFPSNFNKLVEPLGPLTSLGDLRVDGKGGVIVAGGFAKTAAVSKDGKNPDDQLTQATENGLWYDDAGDGPVNAVVVFADKTTATVQAGWYVTGDPGYAPQTRNIISVWDDVYDVWVRQLGLVPTLYSGGAFQTSYKASFPDDIQPIFHGAMLQRWNTNLPSGAINAHDMIGAIKPTDDPASKIPDLKSLMRDPSSASDISTGAPMMPLSLGDAEKSFLTVSPTQYFLLGQWHAKAYAPGPGPALGPGERLDRITLENCLGGRYSPGIEVSFPVRDINLYIQDWQKQDCGPFRINQALLDYSKATADKPFLSFGYIPLQKFAVEPATSPSSCRCRGSPTTIPAPRTCRIQIRKATTRCSGRGRRSVRSRSIRCRCAVTTPGARPGRSVSRSIRCAGPGPKRPTRHRSGGSRSIRISSRTGTRSAS